MTYKTEGKNRFPMVKTVVVVERECCHGSGSRYGGKEMCFFCTEESTPRAGFASDYYCEHPSVGKQKVMGYVEYSSDHKPVPEWCPILVK